MHIETERLLLRPFFRESDAADALEYLRNPVPNCFACMKLDSLEESETEMQKRSANTELYFAIVLKETGKVIGEIEAFPERNEPDSESSPFDTFSPCWMLNAAFHRKGYFPSQRLCEKLGMRREGLFIEFVSFVKNPDGTPRYENTYQYAILKREWDRGKDVKRFGERLSSFDHQRAHSTENRDEQQCKEV